MNEKNPKAQIANKVKDATNILVTVSRDPSVDELSAALALTFMLDKMGKHATAVFSGDIPPAIQFLEPEKTFEDSTSSLRDFIISLDKEKADRLRYKVDGDVVKIFITPYKTTISEKDLEFSEGDFNVELVVAIGVDKKDDLDAAISGHGKILHDATVATVNLAGSGTLGSISWVDATASSYSELISGLGDSLKDGLLDEQIATALLTGIVSATDQFRNEKTSPKVMTMSAQLMAAGANQQLIATKLAEETEIPIKQSSKSELTNTAAKVEREEEKPAKKKDDSLGEMSIEHPTPAADEQAAEKAEELAKKVVAEKTAAARQETENTDSANALAAAEAQLSAAMENSVPAAAAPDVRADLEAAAQAAAPAPMITPLETRSPDEEMHEAPSFNAPLNATTAQAEIDKQNQVNDDRNKPILSHGAPYLGNAADPNQPAGGADTGEPAPVDPFATSDSQLTAPSHAMIQPAPAPVEPKPAAPIAAAPSLDELSAAAFSQATPAFNPLGDLPPAAPLPTAPDLVATSQSPVLGALPQVAPPPIPAPQPPAADFGFPDLPAPPPIPDFSQMPALPPVPAPQQPVAAAMQPQNVFAPDFGPQQPPVAPNPMFPSVDTGPADPGQFKIPA